MVILKTSFFKFLFASFLCVCVLLLTRCVVRAWGEWAHGSGPPDLSSDCGVCVCVCICMYMHVCVCMGARCRRRWTSWRGTCGASRWRGWPGGPASWWRWPSASRSSRSCSPSTTTWCACGGVLCCSAHTFARGCMFWFLVCDIWPRFSQHRICMGVPLYVSAYDQCHARACARARGCVCTCVCVCVCVCVGACRQVIVGICARRVCTYTCSWVDVFLGGALACLVFFG